jgi:hypothetical protein
MQNSLLPRDAADEEHDRHVDVHAEFPQRGRGGPGSVLLGVDAVVDHAHSIGLYPVQRLHVRLHRLGDGNHAVGILVGGALDPCRRLVRAAQLLDLPRPVWLE